MALLRFCEKNECDGFVKAHRCEQRTIPAYDPRLRNACAGRMVLDKWAMVFRKSFKYAVVPYLILDSDTMNPDYRISVVICVILCIIEVYSFIFTLIFVVRSSWMYEI